MRRVQTAAWSEVGTQALWTFALILVISGALRIISYPTAAPVVLLTGAAVVLLSVLWAQKMKHRKSI